MIISDELRFVFLGLPRTASRAIHQALLELPGAEYVGRLHTMEIPKRAVDYLVFCCVRNPYPRFIANYLWRRQRHPWEDPARGMNLSAFIDAAETDALGPWSVEQHLRGQRLDTAIRYEGLPESLRALPVPRFDGIRLPAHGGRLTRHWKHYYDARLAKRVFQLMRTDFDHFRYDHDSWMF